MVLSMERWIDKIAIVTGASSGIGAAIADALVTEGVVVVGVARRVQLIEERSKQLSEKKGKLYAFACDIRKEEDVLNVFKWTSENLGPVAVLINNAAIATESLVSEVETEDVRRILDTNVLGLCMATREAIKIMKANGINGHIIHVNSITGHYVPRIPKFNVYIATKHAVTALTELLRQELCNESSKIKVTSISPGFVRSEMTILNKNNSRERHEFLESIPMLLEEDIADGVVYVLSTPEHVQVHELMIRPVGEPV